MLVQFLSQSEVSLFHAPSHDGFAVLNLGHKARSLAPQKYSEFYTND
jgi:hypothetical protein